MSHSFPDTFMLFNLCVSESILRFFLFNSNVKCFVSNEWSDFVCAQSDCWLYYRNVFDGMQAFALCNINRTICIWWHVLKNAHTRRVWSNKSTQFIRYVSVWSEHYTELCLCVCRARVLHPNKNHLKHTNVRTSGDEMKITNKMCFPKEYKSWVDQREIIQF